MQYLLFFALQQLLHECALWLRYKYIACPVLVKGILLVSLRCCHHYCYLIFYTALYMLLRNPHQNLSQILDAHHKVHFFFIYEWELWMVALCSLQKNCNYFTYQVHLQQLILLISTTHVLIMTNHTHTHRLVPLSSSWLLYVSKFWCQATSRHKSSFSLSPCQSGTCFPTVSLALRCCLFWPLPHSWWCMISGLAKPGEL